jgi:hypothetical protein
LQPSWIISIARCKCHDITYVGQTYKGFVGRHHGHRQDCLAGIGGLGQHFKQFHGGSLDQLEIVLVDSVQPGNHELLDRTEEELIHRLRRMEHGGMNIRDDLKRKKGKCKCKCCV